MWTIAPNGLSQSAIGIQIKEPIGAGWSFVAQLEAGFDPYSLELANSPHSEFRNIGIPVDAQSTNGDSSRGGQFYNSQGFVGVSSDTFGTLTVFRQNALTWDGVLAYDPMGGAYAFSPIGFSGVTAGGGDTQNAKYSTSAKYRVNIGDFRLAALWQFGGYELNNGSRGAWEAQLGGDIHNLGPGVLSLDAIFDFERDAVQLSLAGAPVNFEGTPIGTMLPQTMTATLSNNTSVMALAKYAVDRLKLYFGYEWIQFAPPSDPFTIPHTGFTNNAGDFVCFECNTPTGGTNINSTQYSASAGFSDKILQVVWFGAKYAITDNLDIIGAYYHYDQNRFTIASCANAPARAMRGHDGRGFRRYRLEVFAQVGYLHRYVFLADEWWTRQRLPGSQQPRHHRWASLPILRRVAESDHTSLESGCTKRDLRTELTSQGLRP